MPDLPLQPDEDANAIQKAMAAAQPRWATDGFGIRGPQDAQPRARTIAPDGAVRREPRQPAFPDFAEDPALQATISAETNAYGFKLSVKKIDPAAYTVKIHVGYGEINDTPPDGMTGADDYFLTIPGAADGTEIYAIVTYDTDTLAFTSRSLAFAFSVPDSTFGTLYVPIGFVDITYGTGGAIKAVNPSNRHCGDINIALVFGAVNGTPALFALEQLSDPIAIV